MQLQVTRLAGVSDRIVFVHGSLSDGDIAFAAQRDLAPRWEVVIPNRRGYGLNPAISKVDHETDAGDVIELLGQGAHLVGTSMGGVVAARAAERAPERIKTLTLIEPPAFQTAKDSEAVSRVIEALELHWRTADKTNVPLFLAGFLKALRIDVQLPSPLPQPMVKAARNLMTESPWLATIGVDAIAKASFPKLIVSGDCSPALEAICDKLASRWNAVRRIFPGAGHAVQRIGAPFNELLEKFISGQPLALRAE
jgi:pimeloyl-ACP methyl ester carboxylesterase